MAEVTNHLWQSTLFAALVAVAAFALRSNQAKARHWLWLAASVKFLVPFSMLVALGSQVNVPAGTPIVPSSAVEQITTSFAPISPLQTTIDRPGRIGWQEVMATVWIVGIIILLVRSFRRWLVVRAAVRGATPLPMGLPIPVLSSRTSMEPGVVGICRPVLLLPEGILSRLSADEFNAILAHELTHVRRRDNLAAALYMLVEALFWFHPLVWWIGARLVEERSSGHSGRRNQSGERGSETAH